MPAEGIGVPAIQASKVSPRAWQYISIVSAGTPFAISAIRFCHNNVSFHEGYSARQLWVDGMGLVRGVCGCPDFVSEGTSAEVQAAFLMADAWYGKLQQH